MKKNEKVAIILAIGISIIIIGIIIINSISKESNKSIENTYIAYVDINPLIKLTFKVSCQDDVCNEPIITDTELINEDAKEIYKDLVIKDKTLKETIELLATTVKDNNIAFKEVHIYSNYDNEDYFKVESVDYEIVLDVKEEKELKQVIDELITDEANIKTKEIIVPVTFSKYTADNHLGINDFTPLEHKELFKTILSKYKDTDNYSYEYMYVTITVSGPTNIIDGLPEQYIVNEKLNGTDYIYGLVDTTGLDIGTYNLPLEFFSPIQEIEILTPSIECRLKVVSWDDRYIPVRQYD